MELPVFPNVPLVKVLVRLAHELEHGRDDVDVGDRAGILDKRRDPHEDVGDGDEESRLRTSTALARHGGVRVRSISSLEVVVEMAGDALEVLDERPEDGLRDVAESGDDSVSEANVLRVEKWDDLLEEDGGGEETFGFDIFKMA
jgi:hypothetical protein